MSLQPLVLALLDFERTPGRYPLVLREPRQLFDEAHAVLLLAAGRSIEGLADLGAQEDEARRAARFFVRTALLRAGVDHYTLLGLVPGADAEQVRDHYRLMIRLTHPDFQASGEVWPADAASRINIANDVLSSPQRRADYHAELDAAAKPAAATGTPVAPRHAAPRPQAVPVRMSLKKAPLSERWGSLWTTRVKLVVASLGALLSGGALVLLSPTDSGSLTARRATTVSEDTAAYVEEVGVAHEAARAPAVAVAQQPPPDAAPTRRPDQPVAKKPRAALPGDPLALSMDKRLKSPSVGTTAVSTAATAATDAPASHSPTDDAAAQRLTMQQVHPALTNVVGSLYSSRAESLMQWVDSDWRALPANQAFVAQFNQWLAGLRVTQVGKVSFKSRTQGESLVVDGLVEVHLQDAGNQVQVRDLALRAYFQPQDGRPVLTQLVASQAR